MGRKPSLYHHVNERQLIASATIRADFPVRPTLRPFQLQPSDDGFWAMGVWSPFTEMVARSGPDYGSPTEIVQ
jgi:hypothetical protein